MAIAPFLAMTAAEMRNCSVFPEKIAWMACHFSPYGTGLSNLPKNLPAGSLLMVDDITPPHGHDPVLIAEQLSMCVESLQCCGVLLDFQRPGCDETKVIAKQLTKVLPCPVAVSDSYADDLACTVFLPTVPPSVPLEEHLFPWKGRKIWLETGLDGEVLTLTEQGCNLIPLPYPNYEADGFSDTGLHCHYTIETNEKAARFTLWRTKEDLEALLEEAEKSGIVGCVGLYQELQRLSLPPGEGGPKGRMRDRAHRKYGISLPRLHNGEIPARFPHQSKIKDF